MTNIKNYYVWTVEYEIPRIVDKFWMNLAWMMPKKLVMWCAVRVMANATQGQYSNQIVPELMAMDALQRWNAY